MRKLKNIDEMDALFKKSLGEAKVTPPADVWSSVASSVGANSGSVISQLGSYFSSVTNIVKVALFVGGVSTVGVLLYNANTEEPQEPVTTTSTDVSATDGDEQAFNQDDSQSNTDDRENAAVDRTNNSSTLDGQNSEDPQQDINHDDAQLNGADLGDAIGQVPDIDMLDTESGEDQSEYRPSILRASSSICLGESKEYGLYETADWYVNGKLVKRNSSEFSHRFKNAGAHTITYVTADSKYIESIQVSELNAGITIIDQGKQQFLLRSGLNNDVQCSWIIDKEARGSNSEFTVNLEEGEHEIMLVASQNGCTIRTSKRLTVEANPEMAGSIDIPNIFTPNNDNLNDEYLISITNYEVFYMVVTDYSGTEVFSTTDPKTGWNGKVGNIGNECRDGKYIVRIVYKLNGQERETKTVEITLNRG